MNQKWSGTYLDAHEYIKKLAEENDAAVDPDDITVG
jgi:hypothetical protein